MVGAAALVALRRAAMAVLGLLAVTPAPVAAQEPLYIRIRPLRTPRPRAWPGRCSGRAGRPMPVR